jgi:hypothetical protein
MEYSKEDYKNAVNALVGLLKQTKFNQQDFGPNDSVLASTVRHPIKAAGKGAEWLQRNVNKAAGMPIAQDEASMYQYAPLPNAQEEAALNLAGLAQLGSMPGAPSSKGGTLGTTIRPGAEDFRPTPETEFSLAHKEAQIHAALPIEQGGLGLPPNNTAMDRALAMGFDTDAYHGSDSDITRFSKSNYGKNFKDPISKKSTLATEDPKYANEYGNINYPLKIQSSKIKEILDDEIYRLFNKFEQETIRKHPKDYEYYLDKANNESEMNKGLQLAFSGKNDIISYPGGDYGRSEISIKDPKNIRSRFAAFDPFNKDSANILASILVGTSLAKQRNEK